MRNTTRRLIGVAAIAVLSLSACGGDAEDEDTTSAEPAPTTEPEPTTDPEAGTDGPEELTPQEPPTDGGGDPDDGTAGPTPPTSPDVDTLVTDLADQQGVSADEVEIITVEHVTWSDGSIGCPEPGMSYTQALVEGMRAILAVGEEEFHFHAGQDGELFYCADPVEPAETGDATY